MKALRKIDEVLKAAKDLVETHASPEAVLASREIAIPHDMVTVGRFELSRLEMAVKGLREVGGC